MFCSHCGHEILEGMQACSYCGNPVNQNSKENQSGQQGIYRENEPSYSGQSENNSGNYTYNTGSYQNNQNYSGSNYNGYGTPQNMDGGSTGLAIASMILGIVSILISCCAVSRLISVLTSLSGIVFGILSIQKGSQGKGMAIAGIICSAVALLVWIIFIILGFGLLSFFFTRMPGF